MSQIKYDNSSLRELISDYKKNPNDQDIIKTIEVADHFVLKLDINLMEYACSSLYKVISKTSEITNMENLFKDLNSFLEESNSEGTTSFYKNIDISNWNV